MIKSPFQTLIFIYGVSTYVSMTIIHKDMKTKNILFNYIVKGFGTLKLVDHFLSGILGHFWTKILAYYST